MSSRLFAARIAWVIFAVQLVLTVAGIVLGILNWSTPVDYDVRVGILFTLLTLAFALVGALLSSRRPENPIGWCFAAIATLLVVSNIADAWATFALRTQPGRGGGMTAAWLASATQGLEFVAPLVVVFLTFPSGKLLSARWKRLVWALGIGTAFVFLADLFAQDELNSSVSGLHNPYRLDSAADILTGFATLGYLILLAGLILGIAALVIRYRRSQGIERQQVKWLAYASAVVTLTLCMAPIFWFFASTSGLLWPLMFFTAMAFVPTAAGIAILRYRLFDIDVIINRTLVYTLVVALLAVAYVVAVVVLQEVLSNLASGSDLAVAASTLLVAAIFRPVRSRIQGVVDRRFYRRRYDATRTVADFSARLRDEVDLDTLVTEMRAVVADTMQPRSVWVWLAGSPTP